MNSIVSAGLKYFLKFLLIYSILTGLSLIPGVGSFFNTLYRQSTETALQRLHPKAYIKLNAEPNAPGVIRIEYASKAKVNESRRLNRQGTQRGAFQIPGKVHRVKFYNLFLGFYIFFLTLMLISPLPKKELAIGLVIGSLLFYLYTLFKISLTLFVSFNQPELAIYQSSPGMLRFAEGVLYLQTLGMSVLVVLLIWAWLGFRKGNWKDLLK